MQVMSPAYRVKAPIQYHNMSLIIIAAYIFFAVTSESMAQSLSNDKELATGNNSPMSWTLADCIYIALKKNRDLESVYLGRITQKFSLKVADDEFVPDVNLNPYMDYTVSRSNNDQTDSRGGGAQFQVTKKIKTGGQINFIWDNTARQTLGITDGADYNTGLSVNFSQPLLKGAGAKVATASQRIAHLNEDANLITLRSTVMGTIFGVIQSYRGFMQAKRQVEINERSLVRAKEQFEINRALIDAGRMAQVELVQSESDVANQEVSLLNTQNALDAARLNLLKILDIDKRTQIVPIEQLQANAVALDYDKSLELAWQYRPDYLQQLLSHSVAEINLTLAESNKLWNLSFNTGYGITGNGTRSYVRTLDHATDLDNTGFTAGLALQIPWFGDYTREQQQLNAKVALAQSDIRFKELRESIEIEVQDGLRNIEMQIKQVKLATMARQLSEKKLEIEKEKLKAGKTTNFQLVSFQNELVNSQNGELNAIISYLNSLSAFDQILGTTLLTWKVEIIDGERAEAQK